MNIGSIHIKVVFVFALMLAVALPGCGGSDMKIGAVSGKVTFRGQPVTEGTVSFINADAGAGAEAKLGTDGTYAVETPDGGLPVGTYAVSITPPLYLDDSDPKTPPSWVEKKVANIPQKYRSHYKSGLTATVQEGDNDVPFDLK